MRKTRLPAVIVAVVLLAICGALAAAVTATGTPGNARYYVALGDSLSTGFQPTLSGQGIETRSGYVNDIYAAEHRSVPNLALVDFGCPGDTTTSLLTGNGNYLLARRLHCDRNPGSQLGSAVAFLRAHHKPGEVPLITIDIGINDINHCAGLIEPQGCLLAGEAALKENLPRIVQRLRAAAPSGTVFAAMNLYDTYLGRSVASGATEANAAAFLGAYREANVAIAADDARAGFRTANVAGAFDTYNTATVPWHGTLAPANVVRTCSLTWSCSPLPIGHNIHPDDRGYRVIAREYELAIGRLPTLKEPPPTT
jgi:lysophospholipase L1-like esterase